MFLDIIDVRNELDHLVHSPVDHEPALLGAGLGQGALGPAGALPRPLGREGGGRGRHRGVIVHRGGVTLLPLSRALLCLGPGVWCDLGAGGGDLGLATSHHGQQGLGVTGVQEAGGEHAGGEGGSRGTGGGGAGSHAGQKLEGGILDGFL